MSACIIIMILLRSGKNKEIHMCL